MLIRRDDAGPERSNDLVLSNLGFSNSKDFSAMNHVQENLLWIGSIILKHLLEILTFKKKIITVAFLVKINVHSSVAAK